MLEDEVTRLAERLRSGERSPERLALAAYCGHPAARSDDGDPAPPAAPLQLKVYGLERWGREVWTRAAILAARAALSAVALEPPELARARATLGFAARWVEGLAAERPAADPPHPERPQPEDHEAIDAMTPGDSRACSELWVALSWLREVDDPAWDCVTRASGVIVASQEACPGDIWERLRVELGAWALSGRWEP